MPKNSWTKRAAVCGFAAGCCAAGCSSNMSPSAVPGRHWVPGYAFGLYGKAELDVRDDCPETGAERIRIGSSWSTLLVSVATLGVYTPREVRVQCRPR